MRSAKHAKGRENKTRRSASAQLRRSGIFVETNHLESSKPRRGGMCGTDVAPTELRCLQLHRFYKDAVPTGLGLWRFGARLSSAASSGRMPAARWGGNL